jgi:hypothetical protein
MIKWEINRLDGDSSGSALGEPVSMVSRFELFSSQARRIGCERSSCVSGRADFGLTSEPAASWPSRRVPTPLAKCVYQEIIYLTNARRKMRSSKASKVLPCTAAAPKMRPPLPRRFDRLTVRNFAPQIKNERVPV